MALSFEDVNDLVGVLAWPAVSLTIALVFRGSLQSLLRRPEVELKAGGFSVSAKGQEAAATALIKASQSKEGESLDRAAAETGVQLAVEGISGLRHPPQVLWVDDRPSNNRHEAAALQSLGMFVELSTSTEDALSRVARHGRYDVIISDMGRPPDSKAGYTLLDALRARGDSTPFIIYAASRAPEHVDTAVRKGAAGCTNQPDELIELVSNALRSSARSS